MSPSPPWSVSHPVAGSRNLKVRPLGKFMPQPTATRPGSLGSDTQPTGNRLQPVTSHAHGQQDLVILGQAGYPGFQVDSRENLPDRVGSQRFCQTKQLALFAVMENLVEPEDFNLALDVVAQIHGTGLPGFATGGNNLTAQVFSTKPGSVDQQSIIQYLPSLCMPTVLLVHQGKSILASVLCHVGMKPTGDRLEHAAADFLIERRTDYL